jgi:ADP-heptose:LPS heptosyltransferase
MALLPREVTAVTGACMLVRRTVFERLGGFDEHHGVIKNDLDFCLRLGQAGLRVIYTPHARLIHHEMASRVALPDQFDAARFQSAWATRQLLGDPLANPNLSAESADLLAETEPVQILHPGPGLIARAQIRRILVVKLDHIGDFVTALPAIERLRAAFPAASITLLGSTSAAALAPLTSAIDEVLRFDFFAARAAEGRRGISDSELEALSAELRARRFDIAVDLRVHPDTRHVLRYSGAALLAGFDHAGRFPWLDLAVEWEGDLKLVPTRSHVSATLLRLAGAIADAAAEPAPPRTLPPHLEHQTARALLAAAPAEFRARPLVCIHPGAGTTLKQWPVGAFAGLIRLLLESYPVSIVLIGDHAEAAVAAELASLLQRPDAVLPLAGMVPLADLPALLQGCALFVGNDSGPKHIAAALGIPTLGIHASHVDAAEWGPAGARALAVRRRMSCGPCYIADESDCPRAVACLRGISPAQVYRACRLLLALTFGASVGSACGSPAAAAD